MDINELAIEQGSPEYNRLVDKLKPIHNSVKPEEYNKILTALCSKDFNSIIDILLSVYQDRKEMKMELVRAHGKVRETELDIMEKDQHISDLEIQLIASQKRERDLFCKFIGMAPEEAMQMKRDYESGMSLREVGKNYDCDKSTAKRRLIKLGVAIRE